MAACEELGHVADTLVGGMMFHSDHADLMRFVGLGWLADLHEDGYSHDSAAYRKVRSKCIRHTDRICPTADQKRTGSLASVAKRSRLDVSGQDRRQLLKTSLEEWAAWESDAAKAYSEASVALSDDAALYRLVRKLQRGAERELAEARDYISELSACNWDMVHAFDMGGER